MQADTRYKSQSLTPVEADAVFTRNQQAAKAAPPFKTHDWQVSAWRDKSFIKLLTGSAGGGKSRLAAEIIHAICQKYPGVTCLMLRKTRESTTNSIVAFMKQTVMGAQLGVSVFHVVGESMFKYANGSMLIYGGMKNDEQRERVRSIGGTGGVDFVWLEEATQFSEDDFNELLARMRGNVAGWRQIILTTNPDSPTHWIFRRLIQGGEASVHYSRASDNPSNPAEYQEILSKLTGVQYERLVLGLWKNAEGAVYEEFSPEIHMLDTMPPAIMFKRFVAGVDWGFTNPGVIQVWGEDNDGRILLVEEWYVTGQVVSGNNGMDGYWVTKAKEMQDKYDIEVFICDPASPAYIQTFNMCNLNAVPADNDIRSGIDSCKQRLRKAKDNRPRMFFYKYALVEPDPVRIDRKQPTCCLDEIVGYEWPKDKPNQATKEVPVKKNDHSMDTMRYVSKYMDIGEGVFFG